MITKREIALKNIREGHLRVSQWPEELRADKEIMMGVVKQHGQYLHFASETLRNDRDIVLAAIRNRGVSLVHASKRLRADRELVLVAVR